MPQTKTPTAATPLPPPEIVTAAATVKANQAPNGIIANAVVKITNIKEFGTPAKKYPIPIAAPSPKATSTVPFTVARVASIIFSTKPSPASPKSLSQVSRNRFSDQAPATEQRKEGHQREEQ